MLTDPGRMHQSHINKELLKKLADTGTIKIAFRGARNGRKATCDTKPKTQAGIDVVPEEALKG